MLLNTDIDQLHNQCLVDKNTYNICTDPYFWQNYFNHHHIELNLQPNEYPNTIDQWIQYFTYVQFLKSGNRVNIILLVQRIEKYQHFIIIPTHIYNIANIYNYNILKAFKEKIKKYIHYIEDILIDKEYDKELTLSEIYIAGRDNNHFVVEYKITYHGTIYSLVLYMNRLQVAALINDALENQLDVYDENNQGYELHHHVSPLRRTIIETIKILKS